MQTFSLAFMCIILIVCETFFFGLGRGTSIIETSVHLASLLSKINEYFIVLCAEPKQSTKALTATVINLEACESYIFAVGVIGPLGLGPLSDNPYTLVTRFNVNAAPKNLTVTSDPHNETVMSIQWRSSCPAMTDEISYMVCFL
jgi:hypothetical protein